MELLQRITPKIKLYLCKFYIFLKDNIYSILVLASPIVMYIIYFGNTRISNNPENWAWFGDYIGGVYSVILAFVILYLSRRLDKRDRFVDAQKEHLEKLHDMICNIDVTKPITSNKVTRLIKQIEKSKLYISRDIYNRSIVLANHFIECMNNGNYDSSLRANVLDEIYDEYHRL